MNCLALGERPAGLTHQKREKFFSLFADIIMKLQISEISEVSFVEREKICDLLDFTVSGLLFFCYFMTSQSKNTINRRLFQHLLTIYDGFMKLWGSFSHRKSVCNVFDIMDRVLYIMS